MRIVDLCGGIGGFSLAARWCNHECVGYYEIDKRAVSVYNRNFGTSHTPTDITSIPPADYPDHDILCAGFACQPFSISGHKKGFSDPRGQLIFSILAIVEAKKPKYVLLENVKGILSNSGGWSFGYILDSLAELGYVVEYAVLNAREVVPQNRERVFIVGHLATEPARQIFPIRYSEGPHPEEQQNAQTVNCLDASYHKGIDNHGQRTMIHQLNNPSHSHDRIYAPDDISPTLNTAQGGQRQPKIVVHSLQPRSPDRPSLRNGTSSGGSGQLSRSDGNTYCLDTGNTMAIEQKSRIRRLTPLEAERLMNFPDGWTRYYQDGTEVSDSQRYKMLGNAVVPAVVQAVLEKF